MNYLIERVIISFWSKNNFLGIRKLITQGKIKDTIDILESIFPEFYEYFLINYSTIILHLGRISR